ncbi:MAG: AAA family ATPase [Catenulispora sp.]|nr:AAA family ATPase [Catenulispora sp.]
MALRALAWLPRDISDFTGRGDEVAAVAQALAAPAGGAPPIVLLVGRPGIGKSALAVHVAHRIAAHYPDGLLYANLRGAGHDPVDPQPVLGTFLAALGVEPSLIPDDVAERAALFRSTLADLRVLILLDDAAGAEHVRPLLPGTGGCAALITSRNQAFGLAGADVRLLDCLSPEESARLLGGLIGPERARAEPEALDELARECGRLPLALRITGSRLAARPEWTVATLVERLADERRSVRMLQSGGDSVEAAFAVSYEQLDPSQQRAFRTCAVPDLPDFGAGIAAAVLRCSAAEAEGLLEELAGLGLLGSTRPGRYAYHDLMRRYARAAAGDGDDAFAGRAVCAAVEYLRGGAVAAYERLLPGDMVVGKFTSSAFGGEFADASEAFAWFTQEYAGIAAVLRQAAGLPVASSAHVAPTLRWREAEPAFTALLAAADVADDQVARAWLAYALSQTMNFTHRYEEASWYGALGEGACAVAGAECAGLLSCILLQSAESAVAVQDYERALTAAGRVAELAAIMSDRAMAGWSHLLLGEAHRGLDQLPEAESELRAAIAAMAAIGERRGLTTARSALGDLLHAQGRFAEAELERLRGPGRRAAGAR